MPRVESTKHLGASAQYYHSQFTNSQYLADSSASPPQSPASQQSPQPSPASTGPASKKKHICQICDRAFTTSGHLARHSRVHTGERNHKCPFPGCETRCSRQDNLQQHYRIHLSPGSRRSSNRAAKGSSKKAAAAAAASNPSPPAEPIPSTPPLSSPPALEPARIYNHHSTPPDATPPLAQATLPATATLPMTAASRMDTASDRSSPGGSPHASYSNAHHHVGPMSSQAGQHFSGNNGTAPYSYRNGTSTYQEQSQSQGSNPAFTYVHTTPISSASTSSNNAGGSYPAYSTNQDGFANHPIHNPHTQNRSPPLSMSSRHSISHISHPHPQPYPQSQQQQQQQQHHHQSTSAGPASPASSHSVSSHTSGPPTPTYPVYDDGAHTTYSNGNTNSMIGDHNAGYAAPSQQSHIIPAGYSSNVQSANNGRFDSPPPILAPIQDERLIRREDRHSVSHSHSQHNTSPYIHHPQPLPTDYPYHQSLGLGHGAWKGESAIRKNVGTALV